MSLERVIFVRVSEEDADTLQRIAERRGSSLAAVVRECIRGFVDETKADPTWAETLKSNRRAKK